MSTLFLHCLIHIYYLLLIFRHIPGLPNTTAGGKKIRKTKISRNGRIVDPVSRYKVQVAQREAAAAEQAELEAAAALAVTIQPSHNTLVDHDEDSNRDRVYLPAVTFTPVANDDDASIITNKPQATRGSKPTAAAARTGKVSSQLVVIKCHCIGL
jgi:hypothetical protein